MNEYVKLVSEITGKDPDSTLIRMKKIKKIFGISYKEYYNKEFFNMPDGMMEKEALKLQMKKEKRREAFNRVAINSGLTKEEIINEIKGINDKGIKKINIMFYDKFQMYAMDREKLEETLRLLNIRDNMCKEIKEDLKSLDAGEKEYSDIELKIVELKEIIKSLMTSDFHEKLNAIYVKGRDCTEEDILDDVFVDMETTRLLLGFSFNEYLAFHFESKTLEEKRSFMNNRERMTVLKQLNDEMSCNMLDNKAECYKVLKKQFKRKQVYIGDSTDLKAFKKFCRGRKCFVKKALAKSMGKGVEPVYIDKGTDLNKLFDRLLDESGSFVVEDMIQQHESMEVFNPASVNTVRIETYFDGNSVELVDSFVRFGQTNTFVDNAGAGGIFVAVDVETGILSGNGYDESGKIYETHPKSGIRFEGYKLRDWGKAVSLAKNIGDKFSGVRFIGWDIAYTKSKKWVVVEGNAKPQIICNQTSQEKGLKRQFLKKTNKLDFNQ